MVLFFCFSFDQFYPIYSPICSLSSPEVLLDKPIFPFASPSHACRVKNLPKLTKPHYLVYLLTRVARISSQIRLDRLARLTSSGCSYDSLKPCTSVCVSREHTGERSPSCLTFW